MALSADRIALANRAIRQTFERSSVVWQSIPHWDTGDPAQTMVANNITFPIAANASSTVTMTPVPLKPLTTDVRLTLAQATAATPDALLAAVIAGAVGLAKKFDDAVLSGLKATSTSNSWTQSLNSSTSQGIMAAFIQGRTKLEESGYRSPSCLIASAAHFTDINQLTGSEVATPALLFAANANSLSMSSQLDQPNAVTLMIGRRQPIPDGAAASASPGEEPVDVAVSVPPSAEVVGENDNGGIEITVRLSFALRIKDAHGLVVFT